MVKVFWKNGEEHPIRNSPGYDERKAHEHAGTRRRREKRSARRNPNRPVPAIQEAPPTPTKAEKRRLDAEHKALIKAQKAQERATKLQVKKDAQAARAEAMWRKWEAKEETEKAKAEKRKQKQAERDARILEDEMHRERKAAERLRRQTIRQMLAPHGRGRMVGIAPTKGEEEEWRTSIPRQYRNKRNGIPVDIVAANMASLAPWLGVKNDSDLYEMFDKMQRR